MERRSLAAGVVIGAVAAGLVFAGMANAQGKEARPVAEVGRYQVSTAVAEGMTSVVVTIVDTRTGECQMFRVATTQLIQTRPEGAVFKVK